LLFLANDSVKTGNPNELRRKSKSVYQARRPSYDELLLDEIPEAKNLLDSASKLKE